ncbi:uracil phosphoribosyltransferase [Anaerolentibacter hominis]|uniref:uracil phosphoribosyltransferase n=1 Tax=Anaerolentibacter hominis TaxID=3079009 RepID=UPI0031B88C67
MGKIVVMDHPLIQHKIGIMRVKTTSTKEFRDLVAEVAMLICYEATRELPLADLEIETPLVKTTVKEIAGKKLCIVPILRAGLHMADGILTLIPNAKVGHIGMYRNEETLEPVEYFCKLPSDAADREIFVVDPMLATGGSATAAINRLKARGIRRIHFLCLIAAPEGVKRLASEHPDVDIYIGCMDERLNEHGYILPGLGDAGDRIYGTK